jgi:hypothetical protein
MLTFEELYYVITVSWQFTLGDYKISNAFKGKATIQNQIIIE